MSGTLAFGQQVASGVLALPFALTWLPPSSPTLPAVVAVLGAGIACTALAYVIYFTLIKEVGPTSANTVTLLVPVFGVLWANLFLHETVTTATLIGLVIIMADVVLITGGLGRGPQVANVGEASQAGMTAAGADVAKSTE